MNSWRTVRVFISSTFRDMQAERDWLVRFVFPKLREELVKYRIHFVDVDLRWGVTSDQDALGVCREVIDECHPRFMCILGGRYGWVPEGQDKSITADEIHYGVLGREAEKRGHAFFYFRRDEDTLAIPDAGARSGGYREFPEPDEIERDGPERAAAMARERAAKLAALKQAITGAGLPVHVYDARWDAAQKRLTGLEAFGNQVHDDLLRSLKNDPDLAAHFAAEGTAPPDEFAEEAEQMEAFIEERTDRYITGSRQPLLDDLLAFATADGTPNIFVLTGDPGSGKSALLAKFTREVSKSPITSHQSPLLLSHFIGASTGSTDLRRTLRRLCHDIALAAGNTEPLPLDIKELITHFQKLLGEAAGRRRVILVFDALNQFDATDGAHWLNWLPRELPPGVRIVASVIAPADGQPEHQTLAILRTRPGTRMEKLEPLTEADTLAVIEGSLRRYAKRLSPEQLTALLAKPAGRLPLYVLTALEELRTLGTYEEITDRIRTLPGDARALFGWILTERLARDPGFRDREGRPCGAALVEKFTACLGVSRHGLSPAELTALLDPGDPLGNVAALLRLLRPYLMRRGELLDFYHGQFREAAKQSFLKSERQRCGAHQDLCKYFRHKADPQRDRTWIGGEPRSLGEISFHITSAAIADGGWDAPVALLCDLLFVEARCRAGQVFELIPDYRLAQENLPETQADLREERAREECVRRWTAELVEFARQWSDRRDRSDRGELVAEPEPKLPEPVPTCEVWTEEKIQVECDRIVQMPTRRDRLAAFAGFVTGQCYPLVNHGQHPGFVVQHAFNSEPAGTLYSAAAQLIGSARVPLLLCKWPPEAIHNAKPALLLTLQQRWWHGLSVTSDGRRAISGSSDETLRVWDLDSGICVRVLGVHRVGLGGSLSMTPDGRRMISVPDGEVMISLVEGLRKSDIPANNDDVVKVWDIESGQCLRTLPRESGDGEGVCITPDGRRAVLTNDQELQLWDLETGHRLHILKGHTSYVRSVDLTPDGRRAISGSWDNTLRVWDLESGQCVRTLEGHTESVHCVSLTPDGLRVISGGGDVSTGSEHVLKVWELESGKCLHTLKGHKSYVNCVCITPDGRRAVSGSDDNTLRVWDLETGRCLRTLEGHSSGVNNVSATPDGRRVFSVGQDRTLRVWDAESGKCMFAPQGHTSNVGRICATPDGMRVVSGSEDKTLKLWDVNSGKCLQTFFGHSKHILVALLTRDARRAVSTCTGEIKIWDLETGRCIRTIVEGFWGGWAGSLTSDGRHAVLTDVAGLSLWDLESGKCVRTMKNDSNGLSFVEVLPDDRRAISVNYISLEKGNSLAVWNLDNGRCQSTLDSNCSSVSITPDGRHAVTGSSDTILRVWDLESGKCLRKLEGHSANIECVRVTMDGRRVVSGSSDYTLKIWDMESGQCLQTLEADCDMFSSFCITSDSRYAMCNRELSLQVWDLELGICSASYSAPAKISTVNIVGNDNIICVSTARGEVLFLALSGIAPRSPHPKDATDAAYEQKLRNGLMNSRSKKGQKHEATLAHLVALAVHLKKTGRREESHALFEEHYHLLLSDGFDKHFISGLMAPTLATVATFVAAVFLIAVSRSHLINAAGG